MLLLVAPWANVVENKLGWRGLCLLAACYCLSVSHICESGIKDVDFFDMEFAAAMADIAAGVGGARILPSETFTSGPVCSSNIFLCC